MNVSTRVALEPGFSPRVSLLSEFDSIVEIKPSEKHSGWNCFVFLSLIVFIPIVLLHVDYTQILMGYLKRTLVNYRKLFTVGNVKITSRQSSKR